MFTCCLFCETAKCDYVATAAMQAFDCKAISPKQIQHTWDKGHMTDRIHQLLPGYVFLYFEDRLPEAWELRKLDRIIRCLRTTDMIHQLRDRDEQFAMMLLRKDGVIGKTKVTEQDGRFTIADETFDDTETKILKVDRRNHRMKIEIHFQFSRVQTWVEYEIVEQQGT